MSSRLSAAGEVLFSDFVSSFSDPLLDSTQGGASCFITMVLTVSSGRKFFTIALNLKAKNNH